MKKPKRPRIKRPVKKEDVTNHPLYSTVLGQVEKEINRALIEAGASLRSFLPRDVDKKLFEDEFLYGRSRSHVSETGDIERLPPFTQEEILHINVFLDGTSDYNPTPIKSIQDMIEKYGDSLTEEQKLKLQEYGKDRT